MNCHKNAVFLVVISWYSGDSLILKVLYLIFNILCTTPFIQNNVQYPANSPNTTLENTIYVSFKTHSSLSPPSLSSPSPPSLSPLLSSSPLSSLHSPSPPYVFPFFFFSLSLSLACSFDSEITFTSDLVISIFGFSDFSIYGFYIWFRV